MFNFPSKTFRPLWKGKGNIAYNLANNLYYLYRRNNWMLDPRRYWNNFENVEIDRPVFFLGPKGGGLTLVSRMLRRSKEIVSVSGNYKYWAGADEMKLVYGPILPKELTGLKYKVPEHPEFPTPRGWLYATDDLIDKNRNTEEDVTSELRRKFKKIIRWTIYRQRPNNKQVRFTDKSQLYTIKVSFINELLKKSDPYFVLITRNPYAMCWRGAQSGGMSFMKDVSFKQRLNLACQHWTNLMECVLEDKEKISNFGILKFEDFLKNPAEEMKKLCEFTGIDYKDNLIPQPGQKVPFGSVGKKKWYPLRTDVNKKYFEKMNSEELELIDSYVNDLAEKFDYEKPNL